MEGCFGGIRGLSQTNSCSPTALERISVRVKERKRGVSRLAMKVLWSARVSGGRATLPGFDTGRTRG